MWLSALHTEATLQLLLSAAGACLRQRAAPSWLRRLLQLMGEIAAKPRGAAALLAHDLAQQLWLPLAHAAGIYSPFALVDAIFNLSVLFRFALSCIFFCNCIAFLLSFNLFLQITMSVARPHVNMYIFMFVRSDS